MWREHGWWLIALPIAFALLLLTGCQSEQEQVLAEVESKMEAEEYVEAYEALQAFPHPDEDADEFTSEERDELLSRKTDLRHALVAPVVEAKLDNGSYDDALDVLSENVEEPLQPHDDPQHEEYQRLAERVLTAMYEADEDTDRLLDIVVEPWQVKPVHHELITDLVDQELLGTAETQIEKHASAFGHTDEGSDSVEALVEHLEEAKYGEIGSPEYYLGKTEDLMSGEEQDLEEAATLLEEFVESHPDHEQVTEARERKELVSNRIEFQEIAPSELNEISSRDEAREVINSLGILRANVTDGDLLGDISQMRDRLEEHKELLGRDVDSRNFLQRVSQGDIRDEDVRYRIRAGFIKRNDEWLLSASKNCDDPILDTARNTRTPFMTLLDEDDMEDHLESQKAKHPGEEDSADGCAFGPYDLTVKERPWSPHAGHVQIRRIDY